MLTKKRLYQTLYNDGDFYEEEIEYVRRCKSIDYLVDNASEDFIGEVISLDPRLAVYFDLSLFNRGHASSLIAHHPQLFIYFNTEDFGSSDWLFILSQNPNCHTLCDMYMDLSYDDIETLRRLHPHLEKFIIGTIYGNTYADHSINNGERADTGAVRRNGQKQ